MKKYTIGFILGFIVSGMVFIPVHIAKLDSMSKQAQNDGYLKGINESFTTIDNEFGELNKGSKYKSLINYKASTIVSTEIDGVKTIRVIK